MRGSGCSSRVRDVLEHTALTIRRTGGRAIAFALAACAASGLLAFGVTEAAGRESEVGARFDDLAAETLQVSLPLRGSPYDELGQELIGAIRGIDGVTGVAWGGREDVWAAREHGPAAPARLWTLDGDLAILGLETTGRGGSGLSRGLLVGGAAAHLADGLARFDRVVVDGRRLVADGVVVRSPAIVDLLDAVALVGEGSPLSMAAPGELVVGVRPGWAHVVAPRLARVLAPSRESSVLVRYPPEPDALRGNVLASVGSLVWAAAASIVVLGAAAVMVGTLFRVLAERRLLGMYRAIGAPASFVIATLVLEAGIVGVLGGAVGTVLGLGVAAARALAAGTALHVPWVWVLLGASTGVVANTLGALVPALLAVREAPLAALRAR